MELGTITSPAQLAFLQSKYNRTTFYSGHWIGARDAGLPRQFSWDLTNDEVSTLDGITWYPDDSSPLTCLVYNSLQSEKAIFMRPCDVTRRVLCENKIDK